MHSPSALFRFAHEHLPEWKTGSSRKPLLVHGARQVGKSRLIAEYARSAFQNLVHIEFERDPGIDQLFASRSPRAVCQLLEQRAREPILPGRTLLFLDDIHLAPAACATLLRFAEDYPELHVIAAAALPDTWPAGAAPGAAPGATPGAAPGPASSCHSVDHFHLGPLRFEEFLMSAGELRLFGLLQTLAPKETIPEAAHRDLLGLARQFLFAGGLPAAMEVLAQRRPMSDCVEAKRAIQAALWDDLGRHTGRLDRARVNRVLAHLPAQVGTKLKYSALDPNGRPRDVKPVLEALVRARIARRVPYAACGSLPLAATASPKHFKLLYLDVGLLAAGRAVRHEDLEGAQDLLGGAQGALCRQFAGQHLLYAQPPTLAPELYGWERQARTSLAEVDFVIAAGEAIVPVHVRAGKAGLLRSLHRFVHELRPPLAVRLDAAPPSLEAVEVRLPEGPVVAYPLLSLPFYMAGQVHRMCREWLASDTARGFQRRAVR